MLSNETKIDWQFINNEELLNKLVIEVDQIASKYWNAKGLENYSNNAGLVSKDKNDVIHKFTAYYSYSLIFYKIEKDKRLLRRTFQL